MGCCAFTFTEAFRSRIGILLGVANWLCVSASVSLAVFGGYLKLAIGEYTNLVKDYDDASLPYLLVAVGVVSAIVQIFGGFMCFLNSNPINRPTYGKFLLPHVCMATVTVLVLLAGSIMSFVHIQQLDNSFSGGLVEAMKKYRDHKHIKLEVDLLQQDFSCCGSDKYTDWFKVSWIPEDFLNVNDASVQQHMTSGAYINDDVPFSCCDPASKRPCIHHEVHNNMRHFNYDYREHVTLHTLGCKDALLAYFGNAVLVRAGAGILVVAMIQVLIIILERFLQTSIVNTPEDEPEAPSVGYLCNFGGGASDSESKAKLVKTGSKAGSADCYEMPVSRKSSRRHSNVYQDIGGGPSNHSYMEIADDMLSRRSSRNSAPSYQAPSRPHSQRSEPVYANIRQSQHSEPLYMNQDVVDEHDDECMDFEDEDEWD